MSRTILSRNPPAFAGQACHDERVLAASVSLSRNRCGGGEFPHAGLRFLHGSLRKTVIYSS
jgi:hypothetical protein